MKIYRLIQKHNLWFSYPDYNKKLETEMDIRNFLKGINLSFLTTEIFLEIKVITISIMNQNWRT
jgi:hypothetical protein